MMLFSLRAAVRTRVRREGELCCQGKGVDRVATRERTVDRAIEGVTWSNVRLRLQRVPYSVIHVRVTRSRG